jgi:hypothetical protein
MTQSHKAIRNHGNHRGVTISFPKPLKTGHWQATLAYVLSKKSLKISLFVFLIRRRFGCFKFLLNLKQFSSQVTDSCRKLDKSLDQLIFDQKQCEVKLNNTTSDFLMLENTQFIENVILNFIFIACSCAHKLLLPIQAGERG